MNIPRTILAVILVLLTVSILNAQSNTTDKINNEQKKEKKEGFGLQADIFSQVKSTLTDQDISRNLSVSSFYNFVPGDLFELNLTLPSGSEYKTTTYSIQLQEDLSIEVPFVGKIQVKGLTLFQLQNLVKTKIRTVIPVQYASFVLKTIAQFNVFVYGGVAKPGYVVATSLMRAIDAIALCGGFKERASYRKILINRSDSAQTLDISKFYADADEASNPFLKPGDSIFVPYASVITTLEGSVKFTGTYELLQGESLETLLNLSGGFNPEADKSMLEVLRAGSDGKKSVKTAAAKDAKSFIIQDGDLVTVRSIFDNTSTVTIEGAIYGSRTSGKASFSAPTEPKRLEIPYYPGITVLSALDSVGGLTPFAETEKAIITRKADASVEKINLDQLWKSRSRSLDVELFPGDSLLVPANKQVVFVTGEVASPGTIAYVRGYTVNDYILKAGGVTYNTGDPDSIYIVDDEGNRTKVKRNALAAPGLNIHVDKKVLFETNTLFSNILIFTGFMTAILYTIDTSFDFYERIKARF